MAVIGAGMTGLAAAHHLHSHGCRPVVLEAGQGVGGQVRSRRLGSDVVDMGPEAVPLRAPGVAALVAELGLTDSMRCLLYTSPSPRDRQKSRMPSSA